jgi:hypothetical protein
MADLWPEVGRNLGRLRRFWDIESGGDQDNAQPMAATAIRRAPLLRAGDALRPSAASGRPRLAARDTVGYYLA